MTDNAARLQAMQDAVTDAGNDVRALKAEKKDKAEIDAAIAKLKELKIELDTEVKAAMAAGDEAAAAKEQFRSKMNSALEQRLFYIPSFKIYGGVAGLYDYGPPGCAVKSNLQAFWRQHFVLNEGMLEVECPSVTPEVVLKASGHVEKFTDLMVNDVVTKDCFRADHLVEENLERMLADPMISADKRRNLEDMLARLEEFTPEQMGHAITQLEIKAPETKNDLCAPSRSTSCSQRRLAHPEPCRDTSARRPRRASSSTSATSSTTTAASFPSPRRRSASPSGTRSPHEPVSSAFASSRKPRLSTSSTPSRRNTLCSARSPT